MNEIVVYEVEVLKVFLLVMTRVSGLIVSAPILGSRNFPAMAKIGLTGLTAAIITPHVAALESPLPSGTLEFAIMGAGELVIGLMIGFTMTLIFAAVQVAGQIMDMQAGFAMMNVFNPALETQFPILGFFLFIIASILLLAVNGHHLMIRALVSTFDRIPLGGFAADPALFWQIGVWGRAIFQDGLILAAPVTAALLTVYAIMGLLGRVVPQVQMFAVGFPLTIATALFVAAMSIHVYIGTLDIMFGHMFKNVAALIDGMT